MRGDEVIPVIIYLSDGVPTAGKYNEMYTHDLPNKHLEFAVSTSQELHNVLDSLHVYSFALGYDVPSG